MADCKHGLDEATCYTCRNRVIPRRPMHSGFAGHVPAQRISDDAPDDARVTGYRSGVIAKYDGECVACEEPIQAGIDRIMYSEEWDGWVHDTHYDDGVPVMDL